MEQPFTSTHASNYHVFPAQNLDHILNVIGITIKNRWSNLRSCMNKVVNLANLSRVEIAQLIKENTNVDCESSESEKDLIITWKYLIEYRKKLITSK